MIPVTKRFKANTSLNPVGPKLLKFIDVAERIVDVVELKSQLKPNSGKLLLSKETQTDASGRNNLDSLEELENENLHLSEKVIELTSRMEEIKQAFRKYEDQQRSKEVKYEMTITDLSSRIHQLGEDVAFLRSENTRVVEECGTWKEMSSTLESKSCMLSEQIAELKSTIQVKDREIGELRYSHKVLQDEQEIKGELQQSFIDLKQYCTVIEMEKKKILEEYDCVSEKYLENEKLFKEASMIIQELRENLWKQQEISQHESKKLNSRLDSAERMALQKENQYEQLVREYQVLNVELNAKSKRVESMKEQIKSLQQELQNEKRNPKVTNIDQDITDQIKEIQFEHILQLKALNDTFSQEKKLMQRKADKFKQR